MIPIAAPAIGSREVERVRDVLEGGMLAAGPEVREFEAAFASFCGVERGVATSNGTTALHTALHALGVGEGDTVVTTPFSFVATANAVRFCGATPVFADIDPATYNLDPVAVERRVREHDADAILAVHLYGLPADLAHLRDVADDHGVPLVEDAAQAHGAEYDGRPVGSFGDVACFSFYPTKNMTTGEGGMVVTDDEALADRAARFVDHGRADGYLHESLGHNFRMTDVAATIGLAQLDRLPEFVDRRRAAAREFTAALADTAVRPPGEPPRARHAYNQYTVRAENRDALRTHLERAGVDTAVYYPRAIHDQPAYADHDPSAPEAERAAESVLSLPVHPGLTDDDRSRIVDALSEYEATHD
ncbi:MAG: DegT/DnrJ/EryC1/StrS family aminotransferase [Haloferacaceae archaeon]